MISLANFLTLCDSLSQQARTINDAFATGAIAAGEPISGNGMGQGPLNNQTTILGVNDISASAALAPAFSVPAGVGTLLPTIYLPRLAALSGHVGGIGTFLATNNARVDKNFLLLWYVPPAQVMPPAVDPMATFAVSGSGAGTYTNVGSVDTTKYGAAALQLVTTDVIGANTITATLTLTTLAGASVQKTVNIAANAANGTAYQVDAGAVSYVACTNITVTGGTAGDTFKVRSLLERAIAL